MSPELRGCFVTGTDTGVGKTVIAAAIVAALRRRGAAVRAVKPLVTGLDDPPDPDWPPDHELLARAAGSDAADVILAGYGPPVSPHLAAELAEAVRRRRCGGWPTGCAVLVASARSLSLRASAVCSCRSVPTPMSAPWPASSSCRWWSRRGRVWARSTTRCSPSRPARSAGLTVAGVVLTPWPPEPSVMERSNRDTIARLGSVEVATLAPVVRADPELLADAGTALPLERCAGRRSAVASC